MLKQLLKMCGKGFNGPERITVDFERAMINACKKYMPYTKIHGCFFHFRQALYRKIVNCGLKKEYDNPNSIEFNQLASMFAALAFVPTKDVKLMLKSLCRHIRSLGKKSYSKKFDEFIDYFEKTWIGRRVGRKRKAPLFAFEMWNLRSAAKAQLPLTNNSVEAWHRGFEFSVASRSKPSIYQLVNAIQKEILTVEYIIQHHFPEKSKYSTNGKQKQKNSKMESIVRKYKTLKNIDDGIRYLKTISYQFKLKACH